MPLSNVDQVRRKRRKRLIRRLGRLIVTWTGGPAAPTYAGPGDVVSGATAWYGLRAYSAAAIGTNVLRLSRASDSAESNFVSLADGSLDVASIATFLAATTGRLVTLYDQSGGGLHLTNDNSVITMVTVKTSAIGSLPSLLFPANYVAHAFSSAGTVSVAQPYTLAGVAKFVVDGRQTLLSGTTNRIIFGEGPSGGVEIYAGGSEIGLAAANSAFHAMQGVFNGASSSINSDGTQSTGNPGSSSFAGNVSFGTNTSNDALRENAEVCEIGLWPVAFSAGNITALNSNSHTYWGF